MKPTSIYDEHALLSRLKEGDDKAFSELYEQYWKPLFIIAAKKTKHLSEAEEIVQDIFLDIWNRRKELQIHTNMSAYLSVCVKYKVLTLLAKKSQERRYQQFAANKGELDFSTQDWLQFEELRIQLQKETDKLPEKCKLVFQLSREQGLSQKQIAKQLGIAEKTVESHLSKALRALRTSLSQFFTHFF